MLLLLILTLIGAAVFGKTSNTSSKIKRPKTFIKTSPIGTEVEREKYSKDLVSITLGNIKVEPHIKFISVFKKDASGNWVYHKYIPRGQKSNQTFDTGRRYTLTVDVISDYACVYIKLNGSGVESYDLKE